MIKRGKVFLREKYVGTIEQTDGEYIFTYDKDYLTNNSNKAISLTLPMRSEPYKEKTMLPFFDGLIPEGWLLNIAAKRWKLDTRDRMSLLLTVCHDCIGAVHVIAEEA